MLNFGPFKSILLIFFTGNNENPPTTDEICWSLDFRYCGAQLYLSCLRNVDYIVEYRKSVFYFALSPSPPPFPQKKSSTSNISSSVTNPLSTLQTLVLGDKPIFLTIALSNTLLLTSPFPRLNFPEASEFPLHHPIQ